MTDKVAAAASGEHPPKIGGRRAVVGLADQGLVALASAGTGLLGTAVLDVADAGAMLLSLAFLYFVQGVSRALVGNTMLTHIPRFERGQQRQQFTNAHATAAWLGTASALVLIVIWYVRPASALDDLLWGAIFAPAIILQDACRYSYQTRGEQARALAMDLCSILTQAMLVTLLITTRHESGAALIASWGIGAAVGLSVFYSGTRINPFAGRPLQWARDTRHLLGWFTACAVLGQIQVLLAANLVAGLLTKSALATLRLVQILVLQPVGNFSLAVNGLAVPRASQMAAELDLVGLRRLTRKLAAVTSGLGCTVLVLAVLLAQPVLDWYRGGLYAEAAELGLPVGIQAWIYLGQVPFGIALLAMHRAKLIFSVYVVFVLFSTAGVYFGALRGQLLGAAYGLTASAAVTLAVEGVMYVVAFRDLDRDREHDRTPRTSGPPSIGQHG